MSSVQIPTVGRIMHYYNPSVGIIIELPFVVSAVGRDGKYVNGMSIDINGCPIPNTDVPVIQPNEVPPTGPHVVWMPYQIAQHAKDNEA